MSSQQIIEQQTVNLLSPLWQDIIAISGLIIGIISIFIAILIFRITNKTSQRVLEESVKRAFRIAADSKSSIQIHFTDKQKNKLIKQLKKQFRHSTSIKAVEFVILLKQITTETNAIQLIYEWQTKRFISWNGNLESSTMITILNMEKIYESFNS